MFVDLQNLLLTRRGLKRRGGLNVASTLQGLLNYPVRDFAFFWDKDGLTYSCLVDQSWFYKWTAGEVTPVYCVYDTGDYDSLSDTTYTFTGTEFLNKWIMAGDVLHLEDASDEEDLIIVSVGSDTTINVEAAATTVTIPTSYEIRKRIGYLQDKGISMVSTGSQLIIVDGIRPPYKFDGATLTQLTSVATETDDYIPLLAAYWKGRVWTGVIKYYDSVRSDWYTYRYRLMWSNAGDFTTYASTSYWDFVQTQGIMRAIVPFNNMLLVFMSDALYYGTPSNMVQIPVVFQKFDTGGVGIVGHKAYAEFKDAVFWVGQDNIYMFTAQGNIPIGDPVLSETLQVCENLADVQVVVVPELECAIFGFPTVGSSFSSLWMFNYHFKKWTRLIIEGDILYAESIVRQFTYLTWVDDYIDDVEVDGTIDTNIFTKVGGAGVITTAVDGDALFVLGADDNYHEYIIESVSGDEITVYDRDYYLLDEDTNILIDENGDYAVSSYGLGEAYDDADARIVPDDVNYDNGLEDFETYLDIDASEGAPQQLFVNKGNVLYRLNVDGYEDQEGSYQAVIETGDFDFDEPDTNKFYNRLSMKLQTVNDTTSNLQFNVQSSVDRGNTWVNQGELYILPNLDEGKCDFSLTANHARFKITGIAVSKQFEINEIVLRARLEGLQVQGVSGV
jgi:hypothetical protein